MRIELVIAALVVALAGCTGSNRAKTASAFSEGPSAGQLVADNVTNNSPSTNTSRNAQSQEVIKAGDTLLITFTDLPPGSTMPTFSQRVGEDGAITFIYGNVFHAAGKKTGDMEKEMRDYFVPYFTNLAVRIRISGETQFVYVYGEFRKPGRYSWTNGMRLKDAIDLACGFSDFAGRLTLIQAGGARQRIKLPFNKIPLDNPELKPGDVIRCRGMDI
jgi:protein involved in polysaccharide export with SLBB domain